MGIGVSFSFSSEGKITHQGTSLLTSNIPKHFASIGKFCVLTNFFFYVFSNFLFLMFLREEFHKTV